MQRIPANITLILLSLLVFFIACAPAPLLIPDVQRLPQKSPNSFPPCIMDAPLISPDYQSELVANYDSLYFSPWQMVIDTLDYEYVLPVFEYYKNRPGWGENKMPRDSNWVQQLIEKADLDSFPNWGLNGITVSNSNLRAMPTRKPVFRDFKLAGEGYPFDYLQVSSIPINTPIQILHQTRDRDWIYAVSHIARGWLPVHDIAVVDSAFIKDWVQSSHVVLTKDEIPFYTQDSLYLFHAPLNASFPKVGEDSLRFKVVIPIRNKTSKANVDTVLLSKIVSSDHPLEISGRNLSDIVNSLLGEPYGWGGMMNNRDCSAAIKDLYGIFGIMLPRHSTHQAHSRYDYVDLSEMSSRQKERYILEKGIPYLTLLWLPGHIMLYVGEKDGKPLAFHNLWGIRTKSFFRKEGRKIVGQAVITTLSPGKGVKHADGKRDILKRIRGMTYVVPKDSIQIDFKK